jgi:antitoxin component YwqK of YwqJK toxin-antitoxin module
MKLKLGFGLIIFQLLLLNSINAQKAEIVDLPESKVYKYVSYFENGQIEKEIGFYAKKPYKSIEEFESKLKDYKIKNHGERKEFYSNGQLKEIVVYKNGKVIEFMKQYFEDGEEFSVGKETKPKFQFESNEQNQWFAERINEIESKYGVNLEGDGLIALFISGDGSIKDIKVRTNEESHEKYLIEIGKQIKVTKPANKDGKDIGTKFAFKIQM